MHASPYPIEQKLGIGYYAATTEGIGGRLRTTPEDFIVEEMPISFTNQGPYTICRLTKKSWEHHHAVRAIANRLHISANRIGWAGTKDRNAVATQYISIYDMPKDKIEALSIKDMKIVPVATHQFALGLGNLEGNRFKLTIRECSEDHLAKKTMEITGSVKEGVPNYFGIQRFGAMKPVTHRMGYHILRREYEEAVDLYIGDSFPYEKESIKNARADFRETHNVKEALHALPAHLTYERILLDTLMKNPEDYGTALQTLPPKLLSMFVSSYQSWLFNMAVTARCREDIPLSEPQIGEHLVFSNGRIDQVTEKNLLTAKQHLKRNRCFVVGWMPGKFMPVAAGPLEHEMLALMEEDEISTESFAHAEDFVKTRYDGFHRRISLSADVVSDVSSTDVTLSFTLPLGHYATTVAREYMQIDPASMV
ncbi:MAG TPA: tRNA pseudouridine(13) synthase TruD [Methanocorpusculum sp.]|nr:tRNA pseudouridine(13) synthase TruD [Methanocorpusculum sp.]